MVRRESEEQRGDETYAPSFSIKMLREACQILELFRAGRERHEIVEHLGISPSTISKILGGLGNHLEITLTERDPARPGRLADRAESFLADAQRLIKDYDALLDQKVFGASRVRIGAYNAIVHLFLRHVFRKLLRPGARGKGDDFVARFPFTAVEVVECYRPLSLLQDIERGITECGILDYDLTERGLSGSNFTFLPLFRSDRKGFLFHRDNTRFAAAIKSPGGKRFSEVLREQTLVCTSSDGEMFAYGGLLPPSHRVATRLFVTTYAQVFAFVCEGVGVGIGFSGEPLNRRDQVRFVPFTDLPEEALDGPVLSALRNQEPSTYHLCLRSNWERPRAEGGLSDAAKAVVGCVRETAEWFQRNRPE